MSRLFAMTVYKQLTYTSFPSSRELVLVRGYPIWLILTSISCSPRCRLQNILAFCSRVDCLTNNNDGFGLSVFSVNVYIRPFIFNFSTNSVSLLSSQVIVHWCNSCIQEIGNPFIFKEALNLSVLVT